MAREADLDQVRLGYGCDYEGDLHLPDNVLAYARIFKVPVNRRCISTVEFGVVGQVHIARDCAQKSIAADDRDFGLHLALGVVGEEAGSIQLELVGGAGADLEASGCLVELDLANCLVETEEGSNEHGRDDQKLPFSERDQRL